MRITLEARICLLQALNLLVSAQQMTQAKLIHTRCAWRHRLKKKWILRAKEKNKLCTKVGPSGRIMKK
jgi:hypothetical protein